MMNKAYKFRIYPTLEQEVLLAKTFGCVRFIYNKMLDDKIKYYEETKKKLNNTPAQYKQEFEWLKEVDSLALANAQLHLQTAYNNFFRDKKVGFPKFKSKKKNYQSYTTNYVNGNIKLEKDYLILPKVKAVKLKQHRNIPDNYKLKSVTISKTATNKYYASILFEFEQDIKQVKPQNFIGLDFSMNELYVASNNVTISKTATNKYYASILFEFEQDIKQVKPQNFIGLDFSMNELYVASNNTKANYPRYYRLLLVKLAKEQRKLSKMKKGSKNRNKQRIKVARLHEKVSNQRKDFLHKLSRQITNAYNCVCIEDLNMQGMSQALHFGKTVADDSWFT